MATASFIHSYYSTMKVGSSYDFEIYSYDSSYLHKVVIKLGSYSMTFDKVKGGVETTYTIPLTWANAIPNATTMNGTMTLTTYQSDYSTKVGSSVSKTIKFTLPANLYPSVSVSVSDAVDGITDKFGAYVQSKSKLKVDITASGIYGSTIKSYKTTIEGISYSSSSFTSNVLTTSGSVYISTTVTDSRGQTKTSSRTITVLPYTAPTIYSFMCERVNAEGTTDDEGTYLKASMNFAISELDELNDCQYSVHYKLKTSDEWLSVASGSTYSLDSYVLKYGVDTEESYDVRLTISDYFTTRYAFFDLGTAFTLIDFNENGKALAFGKVSEKDEGVEFGMKAWFENGESPNGALDIPNTTDLNTIMDEGFYCIPTSSVSSSVLNKPYEGSATGILIVLRAGNEGQRVQVFMRCTKDVSELYIRWYYQSEWGTWVNI